MDDLWKCPSCTGPEMVGHPAGVLTYDHGPACGLRDLEDARKVADYDRGGHFERPATVTERILLEARGLTLPDQLITDVDFLTRGICRRSWPQLGIA